MSIRKSIFMTLLTGIIVLMVSCPEKATGESPMDPPGNVVVFFFHTNFRCETCTAIEKGTRKNLKELFGERVNYEVYNLDNEVGKKKATELGVKSPALLAVSGARRVNLTVEAYLYAYSNPLKFKHVLEEKIKPLLP